MTSRNFEQFLTPHLSVIKLFRNMANILSSQNHWPPLSLMIVLSFMDNPLLKSYDNREARQQFIREQVRSVGTIFLFEIQVHQKWVHKKFRMYNIRKLILGPVKFVRYKELICVVSCHLRQKILYDITIMLCFLDF